MNPDMMTHPVMKYIFHTFSPILFPPKTTNRLRICGEGAFVGSKEFVVYTFLHIHPRCSITHLFHITGSSSCSPGYSIFEIRIIEYNSRTLSPKFKHYSFKIAFRAQFLDDAADWLAIVTIPPFENFRNTKSRNPITLYITILSTINYITKCLVKQFL